MGPRGPPLLWDCANLGMVPELAAWGLTGSTQLSYCSTLLSHVRLSHVHPYQITAHCHLVVCSSSNKLTTVIPEPDSISLFPL